MIRKSLLSLIYDAMDLLEAEDFHGAIKVFKLACDSAKKVTDEEYLALVQLAICYECADKAALAIETAKRAQQMAIILYGKVSLAMAIALSHEGSVNLFRGKLRQADALFSKAVEILGAPYKRVSPDLALHLRTFAPEIYLRAASCKAQMGHPLSTYKFLELAHNSAVEHYGLSHPQTVRTTLALAGILVAFNETDAADVVSQKTDNAISNDREVPPELLAAIMVSAASDASALVKSLFDGMDEQALQKDVHSETKKSRTSTAPKATRAANFTKATDVKKGISADSSQLNNPANDASSNVVPLFDAKVQSIETVSGKSRSSSKRTAVKNNAFAYVIKITLLHAEPPIWRRVVVESDELLPDLHDLIQAAMGWDDSHLHQFRIGKKIYGDSSPMSKILDEYDYDLSDFNFKVHDEFFYDYDFGDDWVHSIVIEEILDEPAFQASKTFIDAVGACPPEDCGGIGGLFHIKQVLANPSKFDDSEDLLDWLGDYDLHRVPDVFKAVSPKPKKK